MRVPSTDGVELELHDLGGDGPPLLIAHATGFCAGPYRPMVPILARRFHVWALDFRAHGDSTAPASGDLSWRGMIDDVLAVVDRIGGPVAGFGHSMGGACLVGAELARPGTLRAAFAFEPIIVPAEWSGTAGPNPMSEAARRRRRSFPSHADALARYAHRPPLGVCRADALAAYVDQGFAEQADGTVELKCAPEHEAAVFEASGKPSIDQVGAVQIPVVIARGGRDGEFGPAAFAGEVAAALPHGELRRYPHVGHFGPFSDPDTFADDAVAFLAP
jgi:pimeloyl-ACP methyl ester carboxylesterase